MTHQTATPSRDRPDVEQAIADNNPVQQIAHWVTAHGLEGRRVCTGFRIEELGLGELLPVLGSKRHCPSPSS